MKRRRMLSLTLALLLVVSLLPVSVLATGDNPEGVNTSVPSGETMTNNYGQVELNSGTITNNGTVDGESESATVSMNHGTVENNYGCVNENHSKVTNNQSGGVVYQNFREGTIETNDGTVGTKMDGTTVDSYNGNNGTIKTNNGTVYNNKQSGTVETNASGGTIEENYGTVGKIEENGTIPPGSGNNGTIEKNSGTVETNKGTVEDNSGKVVINFGTVETNESDGTVGKGIEYDPSTGFYSFDLSGGNFGTITTNEGIVSQNGGELFLSDGNKGYTVDEYSGTIGTNAQGGTVLQNSEFGTINANLGTVIDNDGTVTNKANGEVKYNYGTVINKEGGKLYEYVFENYRAEEVPVPSKAITAAGTYYGISVYEGWLHEDADSYTYCYGLAMLQKEQNNTVDLTKLFQRDGYEVTSYYVDNDYENEITGTTYNVSKASLLELVWSKVKEIIAPKPAPAPAPAPAPDEPEATPVKVAATPTKVAAEDVEVGTVVQRKGQRFQVIEMDDGSILVATVGKLSKKDIEDMKAFLAKYFTAEQLEMLLGDPELLSDELVAKYFGGSLEHICFRAAKDIFAQ